MNDPLLDYLLNVLDADERCKLEERLRAEPELVDRLTTLKKTTAILAQDAEQPEPPPHLILATLARVAEEHCAPPPPMPVLRMPAARRSWFRRADVLVAAVLLVLVGGLAVPAVTRQWHKYQILACKNNLALFWNGMKFHSDIDPRGEFPHLQDEGARSFAGMFVPMLHDERLLGNEASVICPALGKRPPDSRTVRDFESMWKPDDPDSFRSVIRDVGGSYAYPLGYRLGDTLVGLHPQRNQGQAILADAPAGLGNSNNHGGMGQNVLFVGGEVRWCTNRMIDGDDIFLNRNNEVSAGVGADDVVLGVGDACTSPCKRCEK